MKRSKTKHHSNSAIYNKERTKTKLIKAVGKILVKEGFQHIRINKVETVSGVSKKAIYDYFGGIDGLIQAYLNQIDFWKIESKNIASENDNEDDITADFMFDLIKKDFEFFFKSAEMQKIILWGISEKNKTIRTLTEDREKLGEYLFEKTDQTFINSDSDIRGVTAILVAAIYYMGLHSKNNGSTMCGIDISTIEGKNRVLNSMEKILQYTFSSSR